MKNAFAAPGDFADRQIEGNEISPTTAVSARAGKPTLEELVAEVITPLSKTSDLEDVRKLIGSVYGRIDRLTVNPQVLM